MTVEEEIEGKREIPVDGNTSEDNEDNNETITIAKTKILNEVIKSPNDKFQYRAFMLTNGIKVIVACNPETDKAAAALNITIGSMSDPKDLPGLAHYLEHMLFMGTEKYPEENNYTKYIKDNAGSCNGCTCGDNTMYDFSCSPEALEGALDRFADFFISPLFSDSCNEREVNAVHSEHEGNVSRDGCRWSRINRFLTKPSHPYSWFSSGNKDTLWTLPREKGIDVKSQLLEFYETHYSANLMTLAVVGMESCDELQQMVEKYFTPVQNKNVEMPTWPESPFGPDELQTRIDILPVKDFRELCLVFPLPDLTKSYKTGSLEYITSVIGHEGPGSLLSLFKSKRWANSLGTYTSSRRGFAFFHCEIDLTLLGQDYVDEIVLGVFQYLNMLNEMEPERWYWDERKVVDETSFKYLNAKEAYDMVGILAESMADYPIEEVWTAGYIKSDFQPALIKDTLKLLVPENVRIVVSTKKNEDKVTETEQYYGAKYAYSKIPENLIESWKTCGLNPELRFPPKNIFIPTEFELKPRDKECGIIPRIIVDDELSRVWFLQDNEFLLPKGVISVDIYSPWCRDSPKHGLLRILFTNILLDTLSEDLYSATNAGLTYGISSYIGDLQVYASGYSHKVATLFDTILAQLVNFNSVGRRFEDLKDDMILSLKNWKDASPSTHASCHADALLTDLSYTNEDLLAVVDEMTPENVLWFAKTMLSGVKLQWIFYGNFTEEEALSIYLKEIEHFRRIGSKPLITASQLLCTRGICLPKGCNLVYRENHTCHKDSAIEVVLQCDMGDTRKSLILGLTSYIMKEPCFDLLRTKEQLGYSCGCYMQKSDGVFNLQIYIQGEKHPAFLESRIENFLKVMGNTIEELTEEDFKNYRNSYRVLLAEKYKSISDRMSSLHAEISIMNYNFDRQNLNLKELAEVTLGDVKNFYRKWIKPGSEDRKKLSVHIISVVKGGAGEPQSDLEPGSKFEQDKSEIETPKEIVESQDVIENVVAWKSQQYLFPYRKPFGDFPPLKFQN